MALTICMEFLRAFFNGSLLRLGFELIFTRLYNNNLTFVPHFIVKCVCKAIRMACLNCLMNCAVIILRCSESWEREAEMYARIIKTRNHRWGSMFQNSSHLIKPSCMDQAFSQSISYVTSVASRSSNVPFVKRGILNSISSQRIALGKNCSGLHVRSLTHSRNGHLRFFSSQGDGRNTSEGKHATVKGQSDVDSEKCQSGSCAKNAEAHARLAEQDQKEWINNEKLSIENKKKESPFMTRRQRFKNEFLRRVVPWEKINVSWENFPYYMK